MENSETVYVKLKGISGKYAKRLARNEDNFELGQEDKIGIRMNTCKKCGKKMAIEFIKDKVSELHVA
jgi:hypothetical protein